MLNNEYFRNLTKPVICARIFNNKTFARCILFKMANDVNDSFFSPSLYIIALDSIEGFGGLTMFDVYGAGINTYQYRKLSYDELENLMKKIYQITYLDLKSESLFRKTGVKILDIFNSEVRVALRKDKLKRLENKWIN